MTVSLFAVVIHDVVRSVTFDWLSTRNSRACAAHSGLHAEPGKNPAVQDDPRGKKAEDEKRVFHDVVSLAGIPDVAVIWCKPGWKKWNRLAMRFRRTRLAVSRQSRL